MSRCGAGVGSNVLVRQFGLPIDENLITIPGDYNQATLIDDYVLDVRNKKKFCHLSSDFISENFNKVSDELKASATYKVVLVPILQLVIGQDCINYMLDNNYLFVGAQGLILAQELEKGKFLTNKWVSSFDEESSLYLGSNGHHKVPVSYHDNGRGTKSSIVNGGLRLCMRSFNNQWRIGDYLLCYSKE